MRVFCDMEATKAITYHSCQKCEHMASGQQLCTAMSCCTNIGMDAVSGGFASLSTVAQNHYTQANADNFDFCTTEDEKDAPSNFVDADEDGFAECRCCECTNTCQPGMYHLGDTHTCAYCPQGQFSEDGSKQGCDLCPSGKFNKDLEFNKTTEIALYRSQLATLIADDHAGRLTVTNVSHVTLGETPFFVQMTL